MKFKFLFITFLFCFISFSQTHKIITTIETVEILNGNKAEALYYFQNNWKTLRAQAEEKGYIQSYSILETSFSEATPFHLILITNYANKAQYDNREKHFEVLIKASGGLNLLNEKTPSEFRKSVFSVEKAVHLE